MAHFAELDENNIVVSVTVVDNRHVPSDKHVDGETWCKNFFNKPDTTFKQTSYNDNFRKRYAGIGFTYDASKDVFISLQPYASWSLNDDSDWQAPITYPIDDKEYYWDETLYQSDNSQGWVEVESA
tara:strand:- start:355 stop:732 length:378 start_codon:yes stop_codon:yes gene_type:complete